jgi:endonuclease/exonuclease/phosphatase family metal-dependent hydrolase
LKNPHWHRYQLGQIFIASEFPIQHVHDLHLERIKGVEDTVVVNHSGAAVCFDLATSIGLIHVANVHLASPHGALRAVLRHPTDSTWRLEANSVRRANESQVIHDWLATQTGPLIVAGDFNTPAESPIYRYFFGAYPDAFPTAGMGLGFTHLSPLSELRIDHLFTGPGVTCIDYLVGPPCGTPHRPVVVDMVIEPGR